MKQYFAYIRVSTAKQGEHGSSLQEQRASIEGYAQRYSLSITEWIEERETAAKRGRSGFTAMLAKLRADHAQGVIIHKIDRSARNLKDWADLGELMDLGVEVHFAHESLDLKSRGGRLSADIQAVVASDFIRNLRQEVRKGFYGRLRQGLLPLPAPAGYRNEGRGKPKSIDPVMGPLVRQAFELYATGHFTLDTLAVEITRRGLRNRVGKSVTVNMVSRLLNNEFYLGLIRIIRTNETYDGKHEPLIPKSLFDKVQARLAGKIRHAGLAHDVPYRRSFHCATCERVLVPERQKGHTYYRCHNKMCKGNIIREEVLTDSIDCALDAVRMTPSELVMLEAHVRAREATIGEDTTAALLAARLQIAQLEDRERRLIDAYIDRLIDKSSYEERKAALLTEKLSVREIIASLDGENHYLRANLRKKLELARTASLSDPKTNDQEKLSIVKSLSSNLTVQAKAVVIKWDSPFSLLANRVFEPYGAPQRDTTRTPHQFTDKCFNGIGTDICTVCEPYRRCADAMAADVSANVLTDVEQEQLQKAAHRKRYAHSYKMVEGFNRKKERKEPPLTEGL